MNALLNPVDGEPLLMNPIKKREPINTIIVDSEEFDRIAKLNEGGDFAEIGQQNLEPITTLVTVPRVRPVEPTEVPPEDIKPFATPESEPASSVEVAVSQTSIIASSFAKPYSSTSYPTSNQQLHYGTPTTSSTFKSQTSAPSQPDSQHHDVTGIIVGLVAAGVTSAIIAMVGLFFFCRYRRKRELKKNEEGETGRRSGIFGKSAKRSGSQNSGDSERKLLARTLTREKNDQEDEENRKRDDTVHSAPYQYIPRNMGGGLAPAVDLSDRTTRAASRSSVDIPLPELPIRPPTVEVRSPPLKNIPSLPIELRSFIPSTMPAAGLSRPKTAYGNNSSGRYSMAPPQADRGVRRSSTKSQRKMSSQRGRSSTLNTGESPSTLAPPAEIIDTPSSRGLCYPMKPTLHRSASVSSQRYSIFPKGERKASFDGSTTSLISNSVTANLLTLQIPGSSNSSGSSTPRPSASRATSSNSLRQNPSGIPTVWMNGTDSPKASPTRTMAEYGFHGPPMELRALPPLPSTGSSNNLHINYPESPIDGTMRSVSTTNSSILNSFKHNSGPLPLPEKSPLRGTFPGGSIKSAASSPTRGPSPCPTEGSVLDSLDLESESAAKARRRNTGYKPERPLSRSPPPALPVLPTLATAMSAGKEYGSVRSHYTANESRSNDTISLGLWSQTTNTKESRHHSYTTATTMSSPGAKERPQTRLSFSTVNGDRDSRKTITSARASVMNNLDSQTLNRSPEEAVDSFFQAIDEDPENRRSSLEEIEYIEPQLARCISITSTSGSNRTTIDFRPSTESLHSRMLSKSTIRTADMHLEDIDFETSTDIEDVTATVSSRSRSNSATSRYPARRNRPSQLGNLLDNSDISSSTHSSTYSPTLSMLNFYSSSSTRFSTASNALVTRSPIAVRRNSHIPHISIPQPQMYIHPNTQLEVNHVAELTSCSSNPPGGSLSSAPSPVSFTTADSSNAFYSPPLDADIGAPISKNSYIPIPTPQIYSSSQEDLANMNLGLRRQGSYLSFNPDKNGGDINSALSLATAPGIINKRSVNSLTVNSLIGSRLDTYHTGRSVSVGTFSTLDKSSFRDMDMDKSSSGPSGNLESSDESSDESSSNADGSVISEKCEPETKIVVQRRSRSLGAAVSLKRKRSILTKDERGRSRERRLF